MPVRAIITQGTTADCTQAGRLIEGITADVLLADKGYDTDAILEQALRQGMQPVIPPKRNCKFQNYLSLIWRYLSPRWRGNKIRVSLVASLH